MPYDTTNCPSCPYFNQKHLKKAARTLRADPPVELEAHNSRVLIVAQAPGIEEWETGLPLQPIVKQGGTAGSRVAQSWKRVNKVRSDFDLVNAVQCYPGALKRDDEPHRIAVCLCMNRLGVILERDQYDRVICFGSVALDTVTHLRAARDLTFSIDACRHPNGGAYREQLDSLW